MPLYEYTCQDCDKTVELLIRSEKDKPVCPTCGKSKLVKQFSVTAAPAVRDGGSLPISASEGCGAPRCCGGGCQF